MLLLPINREFWVRAGGQRGHPGVDDLRVISRLYEADLSKNKTRHFRRLPSFLAAARIAVISACASWSSSRIRNFAPISRRAVARRRASLRAAVSSMNAFALA